MTIYHSKDTRRGFSSLLAFLLTMAVLFLSTSMTYVGVMADEQCECDSKVDEAKKAIRDAFQSTIDSLNQQLKDVGDKMTGKDGEIAKVNEKLSSLQASMSSEVQALTEKLKASTTDSETAKAAEKASKDMMEKMKQSLATAQEDAKKAQEQASKYVNQRFIINTQLLKQDFHNLLKKIGLAKDETAEL